MNCQLSRNDAVVHRLIESYIPPEKAFAEVSRGLVPSSRHFGSDLRPEFDSAPGDGTLETMTRTHAPRGKAGFLKRHALSLTAIGILLLWVVLYFYTDPKTHHGSFFGNAIADWTGVVVTVIATKYFYEIGSAESRQPPRQFGDRLLQFLQNHSLTIFLGFTLAGWTLLYVKVDSEAKWGQVVGNIVSEW